MDLFAGAEPVAIDLVYADAAHPENIFKTALYHRDARLSLHKDLAKIVLAVARDLHDHEGWTLVLKDGLRPVESEQAAMETQTIKDNPHWLEGPNVLFSKPGTGAHPRGMAIDVSVTDARCAEPVNMGTVFDEMTAHSARDYNGFEKAVLNNRRILEQSFIAQAARLGLPMLPLPSEWWDFRFPRSHYEQWSPLREGDLPLPLRTINPACDDTGEWQSRFDKTMKEVLNSL